MSAAIMSQPPVPPRPTRSQEKDVSEAMAPRVPPRPARRFERSISPEGRFAPSPLNESFSKSPKAIRFSPQHHVNEYTDDPIDRSGSVAMPDIGQEGNEYEAVTEEMKRDEEKSRSPAQTRSVGDDLKLHAPKPSIPAVSAKQRVEAVTRTDSDKAASFGIGRPGSVEPPRSIHRKRSSASQVSTEDREVPDDEQGIPEIGQRVPMLSYAGDVQAPSPSPAEGRPVRHHHRKGSARDLPPGSYGMHGHGVVSVDRLDKAYYEKHPDALTKEYKHYHDRQNDFAMSSTDLNKIVRETSRGAGLGTSEFHGTPSEEIGYQAHEYATSRPGSTAPNASSHSRESSQPQINISSHDDEEEGKRTIHVDDYRRRSSVTHGDSISEEEDNYPILADDEVAKDPSQHQMGPAVEPGPERRGSAYEMEEPTSRPSSRATSRPSSTYNASSYQEFESTPLEDVDEYEPLFDDEGNEIGQKPVEPKVGPRHKFPSKDVWEDAPSSVHYTAEVSTPDETENQRRAREAAKQRAETPAEAFAKHQEELAERETRSSNFVPRGEKTSTWLPLQPVLQETAASAQRRFPSRDVWEDTPESLMHQTTVSTPQSSAETEEQPRAKPAIPERPKPKQTTSDDKMKPPASDKPKPQIPARPNRPLSATEGPEPPRAKPAVPPRPVGGKIAALQAGFMSDLNKRLQLGPQAPKKEEPPATEEAEEQEKAPLSDARKGRARGPQRRAPAKSPSPAASMEPRPVGPSLNFVIPQTIWSIDPEDSNVSMGEAEEAEPKGEKEEKLETLATNMAGETIAEAKVVKEDDKIEPVEVDDNVKDQPL